ncbi:MAG: ATP synthase F0 subunit C [Acidobacteria bacterium]|jgi:F-type H+-transporting ATPase subunit c|nr:ATP synthase F0 subunit C [Acidobacteriota bacterium]
MNRRLAVLAIVFVALAVASPALAQEHGEAAGAKNIMQYLGAAFAIGLAAAFGSLGQGRGLAASVEAIGRNPGAVGPIRITMIIGLALIESLVIYALIIAFLILA